MKQVKKRFDVEIAEHGKSYNKTFDLDKNIKIIKGVLMTSNMDDLMYYRGEQKIEINKEEYFPENYESKLLMSGVNVPPKQRYYDLGNVPAGNGVVRLIYSDKDDGRTEFQPYRVSIYLDCEMEE